MQRYTRVAARIQQALCWNPGPIPWRAKGIRFDRPAGTRQKFIETLRAHSKTLVDYPTPDARVNKWLSSFATIINGAPTDIDLECTLKSIMDWKQAHDEAVRVGVNAVALLNFQEAVWRALSFPIPEKTDADRMRAEYRGRYLDTAKALLVEFNEKPEYREEIAWGAMTALDRMREIPPYPAKDCDHDESYRTTLMIQILAVAAHIASRLEIGERIALASAFPETFRDIPRLMGGIYKNPFVRLSGDGAYEPISQAIETMPNVTVTPEHLDRNLAIMEARRAHTTGQA